MVLSDSFQQPLQLKGELMDLEFTLDTDHRKRRRNRTTQSCLNCHTSKRKCDRKRPCQRCIQLGLTGLCVYEIDDPALRDDPTVDETTRLRNRIAELESLVRELRGKPHPRWAEANFRDSDPSERWHSRAAKPAPQNKRRGQSPELTSGRDARGVLPSLLAPVKTESKIDSGSTRLYRFSASPGPSADYPDYNSGDSSPVLSPYESEQQSSYTSQSSGPRSTGSYHSSSATASPVAYTGQQNSVQSSFRHSNGGHHSMHCDDDVVYAQRFNSGITSSEFFCTCRTNPGAANTLITLSHHLQNSVNVLRHYTQHPSDSQCILFRRIVALNDLMHGNDSTDPTGPAYGPLSAGDSEALTPLSNTPYHTPAATGEWNNPAASSGYNPYFPVHAGDPEMYNGVIA